MDTKHQTLTGIAFPISQEALDRLRELKEDAHTYVQLVGLGRKRTPMSLLEACVSPAFLSVISNCVRAGGRDMVLL